MINKLALSILIFGGINWGLIGIFQFDAVAWAIGGQDSIPSRIIYAVIAVAAIWCVSLFFKEKLTLAKEKSEEPPEDSLSEEK